MNKCKTIVLLPLIILLLNCNQRKDIIESPSMDDGNPESIEEVYRYDGESLKVAVIGLTHTHVHWILGRKDFGDIEIVGIVEPNRDLAQRYSEQHGYSMELVYDSMEKLYESVKPEAVLAFNSIYEHLETVEFFAPKGVHIMVEKPLAVNWEHAQRMAAIAKKNNVHLLTNYETSWYASNYEAYNLANNEKRFGPIQRIVFHHGHPGPIEIGCNEEFLEWLTDPVLNGGGAITDFGCYGANLATWFLEGQVPQRVTAVTRQFKPNKYPKVDDDATIVLDYTDSQVIIQASWHWSHNRKDMELYGKTGYVQTLNGVDMMVLENEEQGPSSLKAKPLKKGVHDPFALFAHIVKGNYSIGPYDVSSLENNLIVMQILEAAKASAKSGSMVIWDDFYKRD